MSLLLDAIKRGDLPAVESALKTDSTLVNQRDENGVSPMLIALYYGKTALIPTLLAAKPTLDIFDAAALGDEAVLDSLLKVDPTAANAVARDGFQPLGLAAFLGHLGCVQRLLSAGSEVNSASRNNQQVMPLHSAVAANSLEIVRRLLEHGADVNAVQADGFTPLHGAAHNGNREMVELLLKYGADKTARTSGGKTPAEMVPEEASNVPGLLR